MIDKILKGDNTVVLDIKEKLQESANFEYIYEKKYSKKEADKLVDNIKKSEKVTKVETNKKAYKGKDVIAVYTDKELSANNSWGLEISRDEDNKTAYMIILEKKMIKVKIDGEVTEIDQKDLKDMQALAKKEKKEFEIVK